MSPTDADEKDRWNLCEPVPPEDVFREPGVSGYYMPCPVCKKGPTIDLMTFSCNREFVSIGRKKECHNCRHVFFTLEKVAFNFE